MKSEAKTLSTTEIRRQMTALGERHGEITLQLQAICAENMRNGGGAGKTELIDEDERAARSHALSLLSGIGHDIELPPEVSRERALYRERRGIDIALKALQGKLDEATEAATLKWWKTAEPKWRDLVREAVLAAVRLNALDRRTEAMFAGVDVFSLPRLPLGQFIGVIARTPIHELIDAATESGIVTRGEIQEAEFAK